MITCIAMSTTGSDLAAICQRGVVIKLLTRFHFFMFGVHLTAVALTMRLEE
jgi:hypothetical protein